MLVNLGTIIKITSDPKEYQFKYQYVSIISLILFMLFITFLSSKIPNKKSFVKCFRRKADYSLNQSIFFEKYITIARIINNPKLPVNRAKVSNWIRTNI